MHQTFGGALAVEAQKHDPFPASERRFPETDRGNGNGDMSVAPGLAKLLFIALHDEARHRADVIPARLSFPMNP
jgi:hypothetical protein